MNEEIIACMYSVDSHRHAMLADDGFTGILYLHSPSKNVEIPGKVEATCFAYNRVQPIETNEVSRYRPNPPPIAKGYASKVAVCKNPTAHRWLVKFSINGTVALLLRDADPWAIVSVDEPRGYSKAIEVSGPWGNPWSNEVYIATNWTN